MKLPQPWADTYCLLAGAKLSRPTRPGEYIEPYETNQNVKRVPQFTWVQSFRMQVSLLIFRG